MLAPLLESARRSLSSIRWRDRLQHAWSRPELRWLAAILVLATVMNVVRCLLSRAAIILGDSGLFMLFSFFFFFWHRRLLLLVVGFCGMRGKHSSARAARDHNMKTASLANNQAHHNNSGKHHTKRDLPDTQEGAVLASSSRA